MAISGVTDTDILTIAKNLGISRSKLASELGYAYDVATVALTDAGGHAGHLVITNIRGLLTIDWGDGTIQKLQAASNGVTTPSNHTYAAGGSKTVRVTGLARTKSATTSIA